MDIHVDIDQFRFLASLKRGRSALRYAMVNTIKALALEFQAAEQRNAIARLEIRERDPEAFILRNIAVIKTFPSLSQGRFLAVITLGQPAGFRSAKDSARILLSALEGSGTKTGVKGSGVAVPITGGSARPSFPQEVPGELFYKSLNLHKVRRNVETRPGKSKTTRSEAITGEHGTYEVLGLGIYQHIRGERKGLILYKFEDSVRIHAILGWMDAAQDFFRTQQQRIVNRELSKEFRAQMAAERSS